MGLADNKGVCMFKKDGEVKVYKKVAKGEEIETQEYKRVSVEDLDDEEETENKKTDEKDE
jgi:hypothetical protein